jgi:hypothetical protein
MPGWGAGDPFQSPVSAAAPTVSSAGTFPAVIPSLPGVMPLPDLSKPPPAGSLAPLPVPGVSSATDITSFGTANATGSMSPDPPPPGTENDLANIILPSVMTPKQQPAVSVPSFLSPRFLAEAMIESPQNKVKVLLLILENKNQAYYCTEQNCLLRFCFLYFMMSFSDPACYCSELSYFAIFFKPVTM